MSRFRLSAHFLPIEKRRYQKIKREDRLCPICNLRVVGDEMHYLLKCENVKMKSIRKEFKNNIEILQPTFKNFDIKNAVIYCVS